MSDRWGISQTTTAIVALVTAMFLLSTLSPVTKELFQAGNVSAYDLICFRIIIAFVFLASMSAFGSWRELKDLSRQDLIRLTVLGMIGVGIAYGCAGWSLMYTSVTHYSLIYSLGPALTALFCFALKHDVPTRWKIAGILLSLAGCAYSIPEGFQNLEMGLGDALVFVFTLSISATIVLGASVVKRRGAATATTVMFGSSMLMLLAGSFVLPTESTTQWTFHNGLLIAYLGLATAAIFFLRNLSLKSLPPTTVGGFHNLVPVFSILIATVFLGEQLTANEILGGAAILSGTEMVRRG